MSSPHNEEKAEIQVSHLETSVTRDEDLKHAALDGQGVLKSRFDELPILKCLWTFRRAVFFCFLLFTGSMCDGFEVALSGMLLANKGFIKQFGTGGNGVTALNTSWVSAWSAVVNVGQITSMVWAAYVANRLGRKPTILIAWVLVVVALICLMQARVPAVWMLGRLFTGAGVGVLQVICAAYAMELLPNRIRGTVIAFASFWNYTGTLLAKVMGFTLNKQHPFNWQLPVRALWGPVGLMLLCFLPLPESPWFYARRGDKEKAFKSMKTLYTGIEGYDREEEYGIMMRTLEHEREVAAQGIPWLAIFQGTNRKRTLLLMILAGGGQLAGLTMISTYSTYFFAIAGQKDPFQASVIMSCISLAAVMVMMSMLDKFGRRVLVAPALSITCLSLWLLGALFYAPREDVGKALLFICALWTFAFTIMGQSYFLLAAEIPSALLRVRTMSVAWVCNALFGIITSFATPPMLVRLNIRAGFVYGGASLLISIFVWFYLPETRGRAPAEIDELYERGIPAWRWAKTKTFVEEQAEQAREAEQA
ncbi:hypothetical protein Q8F55_006040 [Vanrija albida]|uniref:Major facilitator superfamily (MFS) profile domain-containing protein n=1 Tax=Vanrija albida TaxID=181172 RepID=A0ABR3Q427_9TREE